MGSASACDLSSVLYSLPVWKSITVGVPMNPDVWQNNSRVGTWSRDVLERVVPSPNLLQLDLVIAPPLLFGFDMGGSYGKLREIIRAYDFTLCPADTGYALVQEEDYKDKPDGLLHILSESIPDSDGEECIFTISLEGGKTVLRATRADSERVLGASSQMILVKNERVLDSRFSVH